MAPPPNRIAPPQGVVEIVSRLEDAGFETWCVGGAVRDVLMGHEHLDWDLATAATPDEVQRLFRRTIPVGIRFGTVGVLDRAGRMHEVTTFRRDLETDGRHAIVHFGASLDEDLARRDFTINAIAFSPTRQRLHDPFDGQGDIGRRLVRTVGTAPDRMREDRLRALRAIRFAARFGFAIEEGTWTAIRDSAPHLGRLSPERVRQELEKTMDQVVAPSEAIEMWETSGAFQTLIPGLAGIPADLRRALDYLPLPGLPRRPARRLHRLMALFLAVPGDRLAPTLRELRFSNADASTIAQVVRLWQLHAAALDEGLSTPAGVTDHRLREWVARLGRLRLSAVIRLCHAVWCARAEVGLPAPEPAQVRAVYRRLQRVAFRDPVEIADLAVDGEDLASAGIAPGPAVGKILRALLDLVLEDPRRNTRADLLAAAQRLSHGDMNPRGGGE